MLKRVNIHFDNETLVKLDEVCKKIREKGHWYQRSISRADLIRLAVSVVFNINFTYVHTSKDSLLELIEELKPKKKGKKK